jgi:hypothetical protein
MSEYNDPLAMCESQVRELRVLKQAIVTDEDQLKIEKEQIIHALSIAQHRIHTIDDGIIRKRVETVAFNRAIEEMLKAYEQIVLTTDSLLTVAQVRLSLSLPLSSSCLYWQPFSPIYFIPSFSSRFRAHLSRSFVRSSLFLPSFSFPLSQNIDRNDNGNTTGNGNVSDSDYEESEESEEESNEGDESEEEEEEESEDEASESRRRRERMAKSNASSGSGNNTKTKEGQRALGKQKAPARSPPGPRVIR